ISPFCLIPPKSKALLSFIPPTYTIPPAHTVPALHPAYIPQLAAVDTAHQHTSKKQQARFTGTLCSGKRGLLLFLFL
ncbi:hypothetical protein, partial [Paenibacillus camerounensis]|uniref:hypothetical protein n=1 Tax=Paenibacillus camerounensis TaxID=1243663 RepID=UPI001ADF86BC